MNTRKNKYHARVLVILVISLASFLFAVSLSPVVYAQPNSRPTYSKVVKKPSIFEQFLSAIFSPFKSLFAAKPAVVKTKVALNNKKVAVNNTRTGNVKAVSTVAPKTSPTPTLAPTTTVNYIVTSLQAGVTYIDLIGKTIIDSFGNLYPSGAALAQTNKPTLGTTTNKYYGLYLNNFSVSKNGDISTVLPGGILKASSTGAISSSAISIDSSDVTGTLQTGSGGTGITSYTIGDILYSGTTNQLTKLNIGSVNQVLTVAGGIPSWVTASAATCPTCLVTNPTAAQNIAPAVSAKTFTVGGLLGVDTTNMRVGIGTTAPASRFTVQGAGTSTGITLLTTDSSGTQRFTILDNGNVGIGTTAPASALNVIGNVGIGTSLTTTDLTVASGGLRVNGLSDLTGNVGVGTSLTVTNTGAFGAGLKVTGYSDLTNNVGIGNSLTVGSAAALNTLSVSGISTLTGSVGIGTSLTVTSGGLFSAGLKVVGTSDLAAISGTTLDTSGNVGIGASLTVTNVAALNGGLKVTGLSDLTGNVGVGTSLTVTNTGAFGAGLKVTGYSDLTNNVGIGNSLTVGSAAALNTLSVSGISTLTGSVGIGTSLTVTSGGLFSAGLKVVGTSELAGITGTSLNISSGNVGIGTSAAGASLSVNGNGVIGFGTGSIVGPSDGLAVSGNVGIGASTANSKLFVGGGVAIGNNMNYAAPTDGLLVQGNVGIGTSAAGYAFVVGTSAQSGQFTVDSSGNVGIGTSGVSATYKLDVGGKVRATGFNGSCTVDQTYIGSCNQDIAEIYAASENVAPGDVLALDPSGNKLVKKSGNSYDGNLFGVVSTSPGLILGMNGQDVAMGGDTSSYGQTADPKLPAVALTGKVPVKVSTENGAINIGDYLTSSSTAGVAMKATKSGPVLGQAIEGYNGEGVGTVLVAIKLAYFNGTSVIDSSSLNGTATLSGNTGPMAQLILNKLISDRDALAQSTHFSEITTDRVNAGLEVITPQLTADTIIMGAFKPLEGKSLTLTLGNSQAFNINDEAGQNVISFDNQGNAYFKGQVVASAIKADKIEGLTVLANELFAGKVSALLDQITKTQQASNSAVLAAATSSLASNDLVRYNANGGLTVNGPAEFKGQSIFSALAEFISNVIFRGDVSFLGRIFLPRDSVGTAVIATGADSVTISFSRGYGSAPTVNVTPTMQAGNDGAGNSILTGDIRYVVQGVSGSGFTIKLNKAASADLVFSWTALANGGGNFTSTAPASSNTQPAASSAPTPTVAPAATPAPEASTSATTVSTPQPSVSPIASPTPAASPETTSSPAPTTAPEPSPSGI